MDIKARSARRACLHTSNPGSVSWTPGGVGRNIAENLARLGHRPHLIAAVGDDAAGQELLTRTAAAGVDIDYVLRVSLGTGIYVAVLNNDGELIAAVSDMAATEAMRVEQVMNYAHVIAHASIAVIDGNLPLEVSRWVVSISRAGGGRAVAEPVSVAKAQRLASLLQPGLPVFAVTPNVEELAALVGAPVADAVPAIAAAAARLHERGVAHVWISRGTAGSVLSTAGQVPVSLDAGATPGSVVDVTGAGDALTAGFIHGLLRGDDPYDAARLGHRAAAFTVASPYTVRPDLGLVFPQVSPPAASSGQ
jgi:pseudouridine kinase